MRFGYVCRRPSPGLPRVLGGGMLLFAAWLCAGAEELGPPPVDDGAAPPPIPPRLGRMAVSVNPASRAEVVNLYQTVYKASQGVAVGWAGDVGQCLAGDTSQAYKDATLLRINYFRAMCGLPGDVVLDATWNQKCQEAALMMSAEGSLSHSPSNTWSCFTAAGQEAAGKSNLYLGREGPAAIDGYIDDPGSGNTAVGHRRWILYPPQRRMGTGSIPSSSGSWSANALWVIGGTGTRPAQPEYVAWPPKGYVPYLLLPRSSGRWSFSYPGAVFSNARVNMACSGTNVPVTLEPVANGYADNTLAWRPTGVPTAAPVADLTYSVTVSNVVVSGSPRLFSYTVTLINPEEVRLAASRSTAAQLMLTWPGTASGYTLQHATSLTNTAGWSTVPGSPQLTNGNYILPVPVDSGLRYYRLRGP